MIHELLRTALSTIQQATEAKLNQEVEILAIYYPEDIRNCGNLQTLLEHRH